MLDLEAIDAALGSHDENICWQAAIALGEQCETSPEVIWPFTIKWGSCDNEDVRAAIGTCVLEHILEHHFADYFPKTMKAVYQNRNFADTFSGCWKFGQAKQVQNAKRWDAVEAFAQTITEAQRKVAEKTKRYERKRQARQNRKSKGGAKRV